MKKTTKTKLPKKKAKVKKKVINNTEEMISSIELLLAESDRLKTLSKAMKGKPKDLVQSMSWAYRVSSAFLGSLNAPERIHRFKEIKVTHEPAAITD